MEIIKALLRVIVLCVFVVGAYNICQGMLSWKSEKIKGHFETEDGWSKTVDEFTNLADFHFFIYRRDGIVAQTHIILIRSLEDLGGNQIKVTMKNGEVFAVEKWGVSSNDCMVFTYFMAENTVYVNTLYYRFYDASEDKYSNSEISLCDINEIVFD